MHSCWLLIIDNEHYCRGRFFQYSPLVYWLVEASVQLILNQAGMRAALTVLLWIVQWVGKRKTFIHGCAFDKFFIVYQQKPFFTGQPMRFFHASSLSLSLSVFLCPAFLVLEGSNVLKGYGFRFFYRVFEGISNGNFSYLQIWPDHSRCSSPL